MKQMFLLTALLAAALSGCVFQTSAPVVNAAVGPQVWIDAPLPGTFHPLSQLDFVAHASDVDGVSSLEFSIDGSVIGTQDGDASGSSLDTAHQAWLPTAKGIYTLQVRASNKSGAWSDPVTVSFTIGEPTSTPTATMTATPLPTYTPTITPTIAPIFTSVQVNPNNFNHENANKATCSPNQVTFTVQVGDAQSVKSVVLFFKLSSDIKSEPWNDGVAMNDLGNGIFRLTQSADKVPGAQSYSSATLNYEFVATDANNKVIGRSMEYSDVTMGTCP